MSKFREKVLNIIHSVPHGQVASYGQVALYAGIPRAARQVGGILMRSSTKDDLPWWRIINNEGRLSIKGSTYASPQLQQEYLEKEGVKVGPEFSVDIEFYRWRPDDKVLKSLELSENYLAFLVEKYRL